MLDTVAASSWLSPGRVAESLSGTARVGMRDAGVHARYGSFRGGNGSPRMLVVRGSFVVVSICGAATASAHERRTQWSLGC
jgi:hypothetical protein